MGCTSSTPVIQEDQQKRLNNIMANQFTMMAEMQHKQLIKQQQMIREDPECKNLMDRQIDIQKKILEASTQGDSAAVMKCQQEYVELMQNPKYAEMMLPDIKNMQSIGYTHNGRKTPASKVSYLFQNNNGNDVFSSTPFTTQVPFSASTKNDTGTGHTFDTINTNKYQDNNVESHSSPFAMFYH